MLELLATHHENLGYRSTGTIGTTVALAPSARLVGLFSAWLAPRRFNLELRGREGWSLRNGLLDAVLSSHLSGRRPVDGDSHKTSEFSTLKSCFTKRFSISDKPGGPRHHSVVFRQIRIPCRLMRPDNESPTLLGGHEQAVELAINRVSPPRKRLYQIERIFIFTLQGNQTIKQLLLSRDLLGVAGQIHHFLRIGSQVIKASNLSLGIQD